MRPARKELLLRDLLSIALRYGTAVSLHPKGTRHECHGVVDVLEHDYTVVCCGNGDDGDPTYYGLLDIERLDFHTASGPGSNELGERR